MILERTAKKSRTPGGNKRLLFLQVLFWDLTAPFLSFGLRIALVVTAVRLPWFLITLRAREKLLGLSLHALLRGLLYWLNLWALFTVRNKSWVTRKVATQVWQGVSSAFSVPTRTRRRTGMGAGRFCDLGQGGGRSDLRPGLFAYGKVARAEKTSIPPVPLPVHSACAFAFVEATAM